MPVKLRKRNPRCHTLTELEVTASSEDSLYRVWEKAQEPIASGFVHGKTRQDTNVFYPYHLIEELDGGLFRGYFVVQRDNVIGNWRSDITRTVKAASVLLDLQVVVDGKVIWRFEVEK